MPSPNPARPSRHWCTLPLLALLLASPGTQAAEPSPPPDPTPFVVGGGLENVQLSPDGARVAGMVRTASGVRALVSRKVDGSDQRVAYHLKEPGMDLSLVRWLSNEQFLLRVSNNQELIQGTLPLPITRLVVIGIDGSKPQILSKPSTMGWANHLSQEATPACLASTLVQVPAADDKGASTALTRFDAPTQRWLPSNLIPAGSRQLFTDAKGDVRLVVRTPSRGEAESPWMVRHVGSLLSNWKPWQPTALSGTERSSALGVAADGLSAYLMVKVKGGKSEVWRLPIEPGDAQPERLAELPDAPGQYRLVVNSSSCEPVAVQSAQGVWAWADGLDRLIGGIQAQLPERDVELLAWQGDRYLVRIGSATAPTEYMMGTRSTQRLQGLGSTHPRLPTELGLVERTLELPVGKARVLSSAQPAGPRPTLLCIDCQLDIDDVQGSFDALRAYWAQQGWAVVSAPMAPTPIEEALRQTQRGMQHWRQVLSGLVAQGVTQPGRVAVVALSSDAGRHALLLGSEPDGLVQAVATLGALTDVPLYARHAHNASLGDGIRQFVKRLVAGMDAAALRQTSPLHRADEQRAAVLLMHADHDATVRPDHAEALHRALQERKHPSTLLVLKDSTEHVDHPAYRIEVMKAIDRLLAPMLGSPADRQAAR